MLKAKQLATLIVAAGGMFGLVSEAGAATVDEIKYGNEVRSCVAEIGNHVSYERASRVRHDVTLVKPKLLGYVMKIDTTVYSESADGAPRAYATYCVVNGNNKPLKFEISSADAAQIAAR